MDWSKPIRDENTIIHKRQLIFPKQVISHVRIHYLPDKATDDLLEGLDRQIEDCLAGMGSSR